MQSAKPTTRFFFLHNAHCPAAAVYTGGHPLELRRKTATLRHFWARPVRLPDGKARSASRVMRSSSGLTRGFPSDPDSSLQRPPETAISAPADCSVSEALASTNPKTPRSDEMDLHNPGRARLLPSRD